MGIKKMTEDKILDVANDLRSRAQAQFVSWVANEECWSFETAWAVCNGEHPDIKRPEYSLGFKQADPVLQTALHMQRKKKRLAAREKFRETLSPEERQLFDGEDPDETREKFRRRLKDKGGCSEDK